MDQRALASSIIDSILPVLAEGLTASLNPVFERLKMLENSVKSIQDRKPEKGDPGKNADVADVAQKAAVLLTETVVPTAVARAVSDAKLDAEIVVIRECLSTVQRDIEQIRPSVESIANSIGDHVAKHVAASYDALKSGLPIQVGEAVSAAVSQIEVRGAASDELANLRQELTAHREKIKEMVDQAPPAPGKDADPADILKAAAAAVKEMVPLVADSAVATIRQELAGAQKDAIAAEVSAQIAELPPAAAGKDADPAEVGRLVEERVARAVSEIRVPEDGKSVTLDDVMPVIAEAVSKIELPKGVEPAEVQTMVERAVAKGMPIIDQDAIAAAVLKQIEVPKVDPAEVEAVVVEKLAIAVANIPPAQPGKDADMEVVKATSVAVTKDAIREWAKQVEELTEKAEEAKVVDSKAISAQISDEIKRGFAELPAAKDGTSVTIEDVQPLMMEAAKAAVAELPPAPAGKDADPVEVERMVDEKVEKRFSELRLPEDGKDADPVEMERLIEANVEKRFNALPIPQDGKSVTAEDVRPMLADMVAALPVPKDGKDADPEVIRSMVVEEVAKIPAPEHGKDADPVEVERMVDAAVEKRVAALPRAEPGKDADPDVIKAMVQEEVAKIPAALPGKDGIGVAGGSIDHEGILVLSLSDGTLVKTSRVVGKDVDLNELITRFQEKFDALERPKDGKDGVGWDEMDVKYDGDRTFTFRFTKDGAIKDYPFEVPIVLDRGVYKEDREESYRKGDGVTFGGSFWIAQENDPKGKPEDGSKSWRLAVKKGRQGKDGSAPRPPQGPVSIGSKNQK